MIRTALLAAALAISASPTLADAAADRMAFESMLEACVAEHGTTDKLVSACLEKTLGEADAEIAAELDVLAAASPEHAIALRAGQVTWAGYRLTECGYHAEVKPRDADPRRLFCTMRLNKQRLEQLREGLDFADYEAR